MVEHFCTALLHVIPTENGGRKTPFHLGYRPIFFASGASVGTSFIIQTIENGEKMAPGESGVVKALLIDADGIGVLVGKGTEFELREGHNIIATGVIQDYL